jgi:folate-binding protein YgfZ
VTTGYEATRNAAGALELSSEGWLRCDGPGTLSFLQRLLANDVLALAPGQGRRSLLLDIKGKIASDLAVLRTGDAEVHLIVPPTARETTLKMLQLYGIADPLETTDETDATKLWSIQGSRARAALEAVAALPPLARELDHALVEVAGVGPVRVVRHDRAGLGLGFDLVGPASAAGPLREVLDRSVKSVGGGALEATELALLRLEAAQPTFGVDFGPETIPQEARLEEPPGAALSFDKGCFLGQEVVARLRFRGHVNKLLTPLELGRGVDAGSPLMKGDKEVGKVTSSVASPRLGRTIGMGYVRRELAAPGTELEVKAGAERVAVKTVERF